MRFVCFCSSWKQGAAVELQMSFRLLQAILTACVVPLQPGSDKYLGEQRDGLGPFSLAFKLQACTW